MSVTMQPIVNYTITKQKETPSTVIGTTLIVENVPSNKFFISDDDEERCQLYNTNLAYRYVKYQLVCHNDEIMLNENGTIETDKLKLDTKYRLYKHYYDKNNEKINESKMLTFMIVENLAIYVGKYLDHNHKHILQDYIDVIVGELWGDEYEDQYLTYEQAVDFLNGTCTDSRVLDSSSITRLCECFLMEGDLGLFDQLSHYEYKHFKMTINNDSYFIDNDILDERLTHDKYDINKQLTNFCKMHDGNTEDIDRVDLTERYSYRSPIKTGGNAIYHFMSYCILYKPRLLKRFRNLQVKNKYILSYDLILNLKEHLHKNPIKLDMKLVDIGHKLFVNEYACHAFMES